MTKNQKILLLSASAGAGHLRAADALQKILMTHPNVATVEHWDMLKYTNRVFRHLYGRMYLDLVNKIPAMLGWFYDLSDTPYQNDDVRIAFEKLNAKRLIRALEQFAPDHIICTHFTPAAIVSWLNEHGKISHRPSIVVTDFDCHAMWFVRNYDQYFVALPETKVYMERVGIDPEKIHITGIPIDPIFELRKEQNAARRALGLSEDRFTILVSAGGFGVGPVENLIGELLKIRHPVQIVAIAGKSEELKIKLDILAENLKRDAAQAKPVLHCVGFTNQMDEYMAAADILVGKSGGLTTSEALARGLPLCIVNPIPGQEERNSDHLLEAGAAIRCNNLPTLGWKLEQLIKQPERLAKLQEGARRLGQPLASRRIIETFLGQF
jgi:processive 1,2-diacylglycerol beta-glucosyltransferase